MIFKVIWVDLRNDKIGLEAPSTTENGITHKTEWKTTLSFYDTTKYNDQEIKVGDSVRVSMEFIPPDPLTEEDR